MTMDDRKIDPYFTNEALGNALAWYEKIDANQGLATHAQSAIRVIQFVLDHRRQSAPEFGVKVVDKSDESLTEFSDGQQEWIEDVVRTARETAQAILRRRATYKAVSTAQSLHQQADLKMIDRNTVLENILESAP